MEAWMPTSNLRFTVVAIVTIEARLPGWLQGRADKRAF